MEQMWITHPRVQIESHLKTILSIAAIVVVLIVLRRRKNS